MSKKVSLARIDKRLLHATVTLNWDPFIRVDYVAVVGSEYKNDPFTASVLQMKVKILKEEELMEFLELNEGPKASRVLVIFKDLETARKCVELGFWVEEIQLPYPTVEIVGKKKLSSYFNKEQIDAVREIQNHGIRLYFQTIPYQAKDYASFGN